MGGVVSAVDVVHLDVQKDIDAPMGTRICRRGLREGINDKREKTPRLKRP